MWFSLVAAALADDCTRTYALPELQRDLPGLQALLEDGDSEGFSSELSRLQTLVPCLDGPLPPEAMAQYRLLRGIGAYTQGLPDEAAGEFLAARSVSSDLVLPLYGPTHKIYGIFRRFDPVRANRTRLRSPKSGELLLDGVATLDRAVDAPVTAQIVREGVVTDVQDLAIGELPSYPIRHPQRVPLVAATAGLAVAAGVLLAQVPIAQKGFTETNDIDAVLRYRTRNNQGLVFGSAAATLAVGSGVATALWWKR